MSNRRGEEPELTGFYGFLKRVMNGQPPLRRDLPGYENVKPGEASIGAPAPGLASHIPLSVQRYMTDTSRPLGILGRIFGNLGPGDADPTAMFGGAAHAAGSLVSITAEQQRSISALARKFLAKGDDYFGLVDDLDKLGLPPGIVSKIADNIESTYMGLPVGKKVSSYYSSGAKPLNFPPASPDPTPRLSEKNELIRKLMREMGMDEGQVSSFTQKQASGRDFTIQGYSPRLPREVPMEPARLERALNQGFDTPAFHGTGTQKIFEEASPFNWGSHFGTEKAATDRLRHQGVLSETFQGELRPGYKMIDEGAPARVIPVRLREDKSLLQIGDMGGWAVGDVLHDLNRKGVLDASEFFDISHALSQTMVGFGLNRPDSQVATKVIGTYLKKRKGINGFKYINNVEDPGSMSYVIFDPVDIKSAFAQFGRENIDKVDLMAAFALLSLGISAENEDAPAGKPK